MEILVVLVIAGVLYLGYRHLNKTNEDGSHPLDGATNAPYKIEPNLTTKVDGIGHESVPVKSNILDVNKDGKVNIEDAKEVVKKTKKQVTKVAAKVSEKVTKPKKTTKKVTEKAPKPKKKKAAE